jgi:hypothetical protein
MHGFFIALSLLALMPTLATARSKPAAACPAERAIYRAEATKDGHRADELSFDFSGPATLPFRGPRAVRLVSPEMKYELTLRTYFQNGTGIQGAAGLIPEARLPASLRHQREEARAEAKSCSDGARDNLLRSKCLRVCLGIHG